MEKEKNENPIPSGFFCVSSPSEWKQIIHPAVQRAVL